MRILVLVFDVAKPKMQGENMSSVPYLWRHQQHPTEQADSSPLTRRAASSRVGGAPQIFPKKTLDILRKFAHKYLILWYSY